MLPRQLEAACSSSFSSNSTRTNFCASLKVLEETSGPTCGPVPNAGGVPGGGSVWASTREAVAAPSRLREADMKRRRELGMAILSRQVISQENNKPYHRGERDTRGNARAELCVRRIVIAHEQENCRGETRLVRFPFPRIFD